MDGSSSPPLISICWTNNTHRRGRQAPRKYGLVEQFHPYWRVGLRYDQLQPGNLDAGINSANLAASDYKPKGYSAMLDWNPSEFSRIRLQYNEDKSVQNLTDHQILLQYIFSLGTHGAHKV